jgi:signal peptidase I
VNAPLIVFLIFRIGITIGYWKLFQKAGIQGWKSLIPFYSEYIIMTDIVGKPKWWFIYLLIPVVGEFAFFVLMFNMLRCFGKESIWAQILVIFAGYIYLPYIAFRKDVKYLGKLDELPEHKKTPVQEWTDAIVFAVVAATLIRWLIMEAYTIPTPSMESSLMVGDFLFVSKFHYGTRTTTTPLQVPLTHQKIWFTEIPSYLNWIKLPQYRLPGITKVKREDVVVFNIPPRELNEYKDYPVDLKTNYIKRCVAIAGDTIQVRNRQVYINGAPQKNPPLMQYSYVLVANGDINERIFKKHKIYDYEVVGRPGDGVIYQMYLTEELAEELRKMNFVREVKIATHNSGEGFGERTEKTVEGNIFPNASLFPWNGDFFGPLVIPKEGMTITIDEKTLATYSNTIKQYDHNDNVKIENGKLYIDDKEVMQYTFKQNYYFMMGDNRHNSLDSRYWGFVPEDHIVGKAFFIWLSIDRNADFIHRIRWNRFFKLIE